MVAQSSNSKRIFKNTIILYLRMIVVMLITLFTSRLILQALGVNDFGLYNVVGGIVGLLSFFEVTMSRSTQRFLNVAMVEGEKSLSEIFASSITVHLLFAVVFLIFGETIGLWFLNNHIQIPEGREFASTIVYHASIVSLFISILSIPYRAAVIAYERMSFLAVVSIIDAVLKLIIAICLLTSSSDRLIQYSLLLLLIVFLNFFLYLLFCRKNYRVLKFRLSFNKYNFKRIFGFVSWSLLGESAQVGCNQGNVILVNQFHPLVANAAMTVGMQINHALSSLTANFQTAFNPQIIKSYAEENYSYLKKLIIATSKISFCILFVVALPISFNIDWILDVWLDEVPEFSNIFSILFLINAILNALSSPFHFVVLASGQIKLFQIVSSLFFLADLPITYILFSVGLSAPTVLWVKIGTMIGVVATRIYFASRIVPTFSVLEYCIKELMPLIITVTICVFISFILDSYSTTICIRICYTFLIEILCLVLLWLICFNVEEKKLLKSYLKIRR